jgi:hypothetical protein
MTAKVKAEQTNGSRFSTYLFRLIGVVLLLMIVAPVYRLVAISDQDRSAAHIVDTANVASTLMLLGTLITLTIGVLASRVVDPLRLERFLQNAGRRLVSIPLPWFALSLALVSGFLCFVFSVSVLESKPNLIDAMTQLTHARYLAAGQLSGPVDQFSEFWHLPNSIATPNGWVSQYPPGFVALLSLGMRLGIVQLVGPLLVVITVYFAALAAERLFPDDKVVARLGVVMLALSPFLLGLAGAFMNHIGAAAFISVAIYCALRSRDSDSFLWAIMTGAAVGAVFSIRPLTALVAALLVAIIWLIGSSMRTSELLARFLKLTLGAVVGIAPFLVAIAAYNQRFFGNPLRFGYTALVGPLVAPGFHRDPTGHFYGPVQAIGYTSSDLVTLGISLLETPVPAVAVVALFLIFAPKFSLGTRIVTLWAILPVVANAFYWHHGIFMGPRMLNEWTPAWALLTAVAAMGLVRRIPKEKNFGNYSPRTGVILTLLLAWAVGFLYLGPQRLVRYGGTWLESARMKSPATTSPSLVFVHGGWKTRIAERLTAHGLRGDSLEAALALNATCDVHNFANWYAANPGERSTNPPPLTFDFDAPNKTQTLSIAKGDEIRFVEGNPFVRACLRQVASDSLGIIDISPLVWQNDLPGLGDKGAMIVRDMGPEDNAKLIARYPGRVPVMLFRPEKEGPPKLTPYDVGLKALWPNG